MAVPDVIIIGAGISGAIMALELARKQKTVLVIDAGPGDPNSRKSFQEHFLTSPIKLPEVPYPPYTNQPAVQHAPRYNSTMQFAWPGFGNTNRQAAITVFADVDGEQPAQVLARIEPDLEQVRARLPAGAKLTVGGAIEESASSQAQVFAVLPAAIVLICVLLMVQLQNIKKMLLVLATGPLALIGVALTLALFQIPFGFVAMLGSLSLFGMVIRNSVILVARVDELVASGVALQLAIVDATVHRVRPILLTATAAILAMIPLTRSVFWGPMAFATMGGLFIATLLTLFFVPALYLFAFQNDRAPVQPEVAA